MLWHKAIGAGGVGVEQISVSASTTSSVAAGTADLTITKPTGASDGDLLIAFLRGGGNGGGTTITPDISGWTTEIEKTGSSPTFFPNPFYVFSRTVNTDPASYSFTRSGTTGTFDGVLCLLKGGSSSVGVVGTLNGSSGTTLTAGSITPANNGLALVFFSWNAGPIISTPPSGLGVVNTDLDDDGNNGTTVLYSTSTTSGVATGDQVLENNSSNYWLAGQISVY